MFDFLKRVFGASDAPRPRSRSTQVVHQSQFGGGSSSGMDGYFLTMTSMQEAVKAREYAKAAKFVRKNVGEVPEFIRANMREYGSWDIRSIPAFATGGTMLALTGDRAGIEEMRRVIESAPQLSEWTDAPDDHLRDMQMIADIEAAVRANPGCKQPNVKKLIGADDGRRVATLISWLEKDGRIVRSKKGSSYELFIPGQGSAPAVREEREVASHRTDRGAAKCRVIDFSRLQTLTLPRAPLSWEERDSRTPEPIPVPDAQFEVSGAHGWAIESIEKIPMADRPDTAYRQLHPTDDGLIVLDDLGNSESCGNAPASAIRFDRSGTLAADEPLAHDVYRLGVNAMGQGLVAMSKKCVVHAYNADLKPLFETQMALAAEVRALQKRLDIDDGSLKNHLRSVALAHDMTRYLVTGVDEAWCIGSEGRALWGLRFPLNENWRRVVSDQDANIGTSQELDEALRLMELALPVTPAAIKKRFRELAMQWHPDRHGGDQASHERMVALTDAVSVLRAADASEIADAAGPAFVRTLYEQTTQVSDSDLLTVSVSFGGGEAQAADWIYASAFAGRSLGAYLAGYSGKIVKVDESGEPVRAYDVGSVPRRIVDTGDYLYFLTDTRLYVLRGEQLYAVIDTWDAGNLVMAQTGFGLLEGKRFRWFSEEGHLIGTIVSKAPLRRVYWSKDGLAVETRQHRAVVSGASAWWETEAGRS